MPVASHGKYDSASIICFRAAELEIVGQTTTESTQPSKTLSSAWTFLDHQRSFPGRAQYDVITFAEV
jgi:hypothetical protein